MGSDSSATDHDRSREKWLIVAGDFVRTGGMDVANLMLAFYLAGQGHEVHLVAHRVADDLAAASHVHVHLVPKPLNSYRLGAPFLSIAGRIWARKIVKHGGRVVVNGGNCVWADINWVHYVHGVYTEKSGVGAVRGLLTKMDQRDERRALHAARFVVANSLATKHALVERLSIEANKIEVVYYGSDPEKFSPPTELQKSAIRRRLHWDRDNSAKAVFVGGLGDQRKGFDILFGAWTKLCEVPSWDVDLVVIGQGAELKDWIRRARARPILDRRVRFMGFRRDVSDILRASDVLISPTRYEAYGLAVQEALCCGIPAIVSAAAGVSERYPAELKPLLLEDLTVDGLVEKVILWRTWCDKWSAAASIFGGRLRTESWHHNMGTLVTAVSGTNA